jgi:C4-dicarboxylate-binding protein DctP
MRAFILIFLFIVLPPANLHAGDAPVTIRLAAQARAGTPAMETLARFKARVEAETKGGITIGIRDTADSQDSVGDAVASGGAEMGIVNLSRYAKTIPVADVFQLPFLFNSSAILTAARAPGSEIRSIVEEAILAGANARVLWWVSHGQMLMLSRGAPSSGPESIAGKTVRTMGPVTGALVSHCGGKPVELYGEALREAYAKHQTDFGMSSVTVVVNFEYWQHFDAVTRTNHASAQYVAVINEAFWQRLSDRQRAIIAVAGHAAGEEAAVQLAEVESNAYRLLTEKHGMKAATPSEDELMRWRICSGDVLTQFLDRTGEQGRQLMAAYGRLSQQPCCNQGTVAALPGRK